MKNRVKYINYRLNGSTETIEELPYNTKQDRIDFWKTLKEYTIAYNQGLVYASSRFYPDLCGGR